MSTCNDWTWKHQDFERLCPRFPRTTGRSLHYQVENHVRTKFATPILYAIDNFKNYYIFPTYTQPLIISFVYISIEILVIFLFSSICFSSILYHSSQKRYVFQKQNIIKFGYQFLLCNRYHVYLLMKKHFDRILTHFGDATQKKQIFFVRTWFST